MIDFESWGRYPKSKQKLVPLYWSHDFPIHADEGLSQLPVGLGRSYGDVCLNDRNILLLTRGLDRFRSFDPQTGIVCCDSGVTVGEILDFAVQRGWFLPVVPGTKFVTVGGAIANDVHGKNHHIAGTLGRHVLRFGLARSDGTRIVCSPTINSDWYSATIGGLGLTGLIEWAEIQLKPVASRKISYRTTQFHGLDEFLALSKENSNCEYTVAWIDCIATGRHSSRGIFICGDHSGRVEPSSSTSKLKLTIPFDFPGFVLSPVGVALFNAVYFHKQRKKSKAAVVDYESFFFPLDSMLHWNRMYGKAGLLQFQCVIPYAEGLNTMDEILNVIKGSRLASFLGVLKVFGSTPSPGMMSFPMPGITLALDFPIKSDHTFALLRQLGALTAGAGGRIYPAKDACMTPAQFHQFYPHPEFAAYIDQKFSSSFWRRVNGV